MIPSIVKPLNNEHTHLGPSILPFLALLPSVHVYFWFVLYLEVCPLSESPLLEVFNVFPPIPSQIQRILEGGEPMEGEGSGLSANPDELVALIDETESKISELQAQLADEAAKMDRYKVRAGIGTQKLGQKEIDDRERQRVVKPIAVRGILFSLRSLRIFVGSTTICH